MSDELIINIGSDITVRTHAGDDEAMLSYSDDIVVKAREGREVAVALTEQGPQGPQGPQGQATPELIEASNRAVASAAAALVDADRAEAAANAAENSAENSEDSAAAAAGSATAANTARTGSETARTGAEAAQASATTAKTGAENAKTAAETAKSGADTAKANAEAAQAAAEQARDDILGVLEDATEQANAAAQSATDAGQSAIDAAQSAADALAYKNSASSSAGSATNSATQALQAKSDAEGFVTAVTTARNEAVAAKDTAVAKATEAGAARDETVSANNTVQLAKDEVVTARDVVNTTANTVAGIKSDIEDLVDQIGDADFTIYAKKSVNGADFTDPAAFRTNLNLQIALPVVDNADAGAGTSQALGLWSPAAVRLNVSSFVTGYAAQKIHVHSTADIIDLDAHLATLAPLEDAHLLGTPTAPTAAIGTNTDQIATMAALKAATDKAISDLIDGAPGALDTLIEFAEALGNDPNFASTITTQVSYKAPIADPEFTGIPKAPTAAPGTSTLQIATTAFVAAGLALKAEAVHIHAIADITDLQTALDAKLDKAGGSMTGDLTVPRVRVTNTTDASAASTTHPFQIGLTTAANIAIDTKSIVARNNGVLSALSILAASMSVGGPVTVTGTINASGVITSASDITASSDRKLKKNLTVIEGALDKIEQLTGYTYDRKDINARQTGLIAQDVQKVLPEAVGSSELGLTVAYGQLAGLFVEAIKELRAEIASLKAEIEVR